MWGIKQIIVTNETSNLIHEYSQMHIFMFVSWHYCSVSVSPPHRAPASSSWTPGTRPPRRWPSCWWPPAQTDALPLSFWPISETNVSNHRKSFRILFEKHAVPSVTICLCVCSDLLCSSLLLSLLSSLSFLASLWDSDPGGSQQSQREAVGCGGNFKWMNEICGFISLLWCWWIGVMGINSLPREVLT